MTAFSNLNAKAQCLLKSISTQRRQTHSGEMDRRKNLNTFVWEKHDSPTLFNRQTIVFFRGILVKDLTIKSPSFQHNSQIPKKHSCDGEDTNPPLTIEGIPKESKKPCIGCR
jgi:hypothetical protein